MLSQQGLTLKSESVKMTTTLGAAGRQENQGLDPQQSFFGNKIQAQILRVGESLERTKYFAIIVPSVEWIAETIQLGDLSAAPPPIRLMFTPWHTGIRQSQICVNIASTQLVRHSNSHSYLFLCHDVAESGLSKHTKIKSL